MGDGPCGFQYLGVSEKDLLLAMRVLREKGLLHSNSATQPEYVLPTDKLLTQESSEKDGRQEAVQPKLSRLNLPTKDVLLTAMRTVLEQHVVSALIVIDLDNFKSVNDITQSHAKGDEF